MDKVHYPPSAMDKLTKTISKPWKVPSGDVPRTQIIKLEGIEAGQCADCHIIYPRIVGEAVIPYCRICDGLTEDIKIDIHYPEGK